MYERFTRIDDLTRADHYYLEPADNCLYLGEYTARGSYAASPTNGLIFNLKKPMNRRGRPEWMYKGRAIQQCADALLSTISKESWESATFVPVPPSKARSDPLYDDRLRRILDIVGERYDVDIRELVVQRESTPASHAGDDRASIDELVANYEIERTLTTQPFRNNRAIIFDDMLTTGRHYQAMKRVISDAIPGLEFHGLFVARRVPRSIMDIDFPTPIE